MTKKLYIKTYGCQMNVYDSARMGEILAPLGYGPSDAPALADMVILNPCHIREKASEKVYSELGRLKRLKEKKEKTGGRMIVAVAGCVAQAEGEEMLRRAPFLDMVFGPQTYHRLPEMVARAERSAGAQLDTDFPAKPKFDSLPEPGTGDQASAFLTVQEGCDKFCAFCVVPYTRGSEYSRPAAQILADARVLVAKGVREITVLGQNVNNYHGSSPQDGKEEWGLGRLIAELAEIDGLARLRYTTSYPADVDGALIAAHRDVPQLMPFLHLPVQSGSDRILAAMNRRHTVDDYRALADRLKEARPDLALSSDFIVGFPGESDKDFNETLKLVDEIGFVQAYSFKYSPRPGTPAASLEAQVPERLKAERLAALQDLLNSQQQAFNESSVGKIMPVLFDRRGRHEAQWVGRSPYMQPVHVTASADILGTVVSVRIEAGYANSLAASLVLEEESVIAPLQNERAIA
ncbi:MAG TPA: tRNA (N6-isopentenyl adenosine(37)-C2)-methylthiotransferase MiaB [Rhodospirillales bacterium]|nr:tRNA (N6-isopentenyl adenosine(37)-C2)-methylthiotransferase MiaB [Rhodospirillales bacterium]